MSLEILRCPLDKAIIHQSGNGFVCSNCRRHFPHVEVALGHVVPDLRCKNETQKVQLEFDIPQTTLKGEITERFGFATAAKFKSMPRKEIRRRFGTKLRKEILYYVAITRSAQGSEARVLDLGCGSGGNKRYLSSVGFKHIISVDYWSSGAEYLVDVHRLPFAASSFDMILTTATLEHFYNPFIAFAEMSRVLRSGGVLIASGSFWESWHAKSCFHFTPTGLYILCQSTNLVVKDLWSGWGFIPSISTHALGLGKLKPLTYKLQTVFDATLGLFRGRDNVIRHRMKTSGSFGIYAKKNS